MTVRYCIDFLVVFSVSLLLSASVISAAQCIAPECTLITCKNMSASSVKCMVLDKSRCTDKYLWADTVDIGNPCDKVASAQSQRTVFQSGCSEVCNNYSPSNAPREMTPPASGGTNLGPATYHICGSGNSN